MNPTELPLGSAREAKDPVFAILNADPKPEDLEALSFPSVSMPWFIVARSFFGVSSQPATATQKK